MNRYSLFVMLMSMQAVLAIDEAMVVPLANAASFNVNSAAQLTSALTTAQNNGEDDTVQLVQGSYSGNFIYSSHEANSLTILGGWTSDFTNRVIQPANTVLDGARQERYW